LKFIVAFLLLVPFNIFAEEYIVTGEYQGKNIYVQNPLSEDKVNFCTEYVYLNDELVVRFPKTSAYEIDLEELSVGDPLVIRIVHKLGCTPKIINPQVIRTKSKFQFLSINADDNEISWMTSGEYEGGIFYVEKYVQSEWIVDKSVYGKGNFGTNQYSVSPEYFAGDNKLRIKYTTENGHTFYSNIFDHYSTMDPISFHPTMVSDKIYLSRRTDFQVLDPSGKLMTKGNSDVINCTSLNEGLYYLIIENRQEKFFKK